MEEDKKLLGEVMSHYRAWTEDNEKRITRKGGWNDITDAYYGKLPDDWPFISKTVDPRIRTVLIEKNARISNGKLRGRLVPRENSDIVGATINNAVLEFQWDSANYGGSMFTKVSLADMDTRLYGSKFALVLWKTIKNEEGKIIYEGNEFQPLDIRDCGMDYAASHIKCAKWFQFRTWEYIDDLEKQLNPDGTPVFKNLDKIKSKIQKYGNKIKRDNAYNRRIKDLKGLEDRVGTDRSFPMVELVRELREDKWITFSPQTKEIIQEIDNPHKHGKIPVVQLRYNALQDDPIGESDVEPVLPLWKAIQANLCGYMDEVMLKMRPPLKIVENQVRIETIVQNPEAQWIVNSPDAVTEMQYNGESIRYFQTTHSALVNAFNVAMGEMSQGTGVADPFNPEKTATEVRAMTRQQNARDQKNQADLGEFIKDIMMFWHANNKQFLFSDPKKKKHILKIVGKDNFEKLQRAGLDQYEVSDENMQMIADTLAQNPELAGDEITMQSMLDAAKTPMYPVFDNPEETDPNKLKYAPKLTVSDQGDVADLHITEEDLAGEYDYIPDVKSMSAGAAEELSQGRQRAIALLTTDQNVLQLLAQEGYKPKVKELLSSNLEDFGLRDADRFFEKIENGQINPTAQPASGIGGAVPPIQNGGVPQIPQADPTQDGQPMAGSIPL